MKKISAMKDTLIMDNFMVKVNLYKKILDIQEIGLIINEMVLVNRLKLMNQVTDLLNMQVFGNKINKKD